MSAHASTPGEQLLRRHLRWREEAFTGARYIPDQTLVEVSKPPAEAQAEGIELLASIGFVNGMGHAVQVLAEWRDEKWRCRFCFGIADPYVLLKGPHPMDRAPSKKQLEMLEAGRAKLSDRFGATVKVEG